jgi:hypothetical protein
MNLNKGICSLTACIFLHAVDKYFPTAEEIAKIIGSGGYIEGEPTMQIMVNIEKYKF